MAVTGRITKSLRQLTEAADQVEAGNFDYEMKYEGLDEVGTLTLTFNRLTDHLKTQFSNLNDLAYADALTSLRNKGAFDLYSANIQADFSEAGRMEPYGVIIFDCNNLKVINDTYGHDKGDLYLQKPPKPSVMSLETRRYSASAEMSSRPFSQMNPIRSVMT
jgi:GGDEF domain-containing protein